MPDFDLKNQYSSSQDELQAPPDNSSDTLGPTDLTGDDIKQMQEVKLELI